MDREYILIDKDTDEKVSHKYFPADCTEKEIDEWLAEINRNEYEVFMKCQ